MLICSPDNTSRHLSFTSHFAPIPSHRAHLTSVVRVRSAKAGAINSRKNRLPPPRAIFKDGKVCSFVGVEIIADLSFSSNFNPKYETLPYQPIPSPATLLSPRTANQPRRRRRHGFQDRRGPKGLRLSRKRWDCSWDMQTS